MRDVLFQIIEYAGIPIGIMLFTIMGNKLINADPISKNHHEGLLGRGLELMQIICISTLLFGLSFFGHTNGQELPNSKMWVVIVVFGITIAEFVVIMLVIINVREWGLESSRTKKTTNIVALTFWIVLVGSIVISYQLVHNRVHVTDGTHVENKIDSAEQNHVRNLHDTVVNGQSIHKSPDKQIIKTTPIIGKRMLISLSILILIIAGLISVWIIRSSQRRRKNKILESYSKALLLAGNGDPTKAIEKLNTTLEKTPSDSALIIDIYMKLARIYQALGDHKNVLTQIGNAQETQAYNSFSYLKDGVLSYKADILLRSGDLEGAENTIDMISSESTSSKLKIQLLKLQKAAKKSSDD